MTFSTDTEMPKIIHQFLSNNSIYWNADFTSTSMMGMFTCSTVSKPTTATDTAVLNETTNAQLNAEVGMLTCSE